MPKASQKEINHRPVHICFFLGSVSGQGGTERVTTLIANGLAERGYQVSLLSLWSGHEPAFPVDDRIQLAEIFDQSHKFRWKYTTIVRRLRRFLKENQIDVLISADVILVFYAIPACARTEVRHIAWEHFNFLADLKKRHRKLARRLAARFADAVVLLTRQDLHLWKPHVHRQAKLIAIPNPVTFPLISVEERSWDHKLAIAVGRLTYQKGFDRLIRGWQDIAAAAPDWQLHLIGAGEDQAALEQQIRDAGLEQVVKIIPFDQHIDAYYRKASIFCLPSRFEGLPMVLLEAQAFALPSVCFDCYTGPADVIEEGKNGFLVEEGDLPGFARRLLALIEDETRRKQMGLAALAMAGRFEKTTVIDQWDALLYRTNGLTSS
jgi:glycosyltransferase involved in cell wall biosynthesis